MPGLASTWAHSKALRKQLTASVSPLPEPIRAINIGICLCMLHERRVPGPVLQKVPSNIPKGFINSKKVSLPTALTAKKQRTDKVELLKLVGRG